MSNVVSDKKEMQSIDSSDWYTSITNDIKEVNNLIASLQSALSSLQTTVNNNKSDFDDFVTTVTTKGQDTYKIYGAYSG